VSSQDKGNFNKDRKRASEANQMGQSGGGKRQGSQTGGKQGQQTGGTHTDDPSRAAEMERKGGEHSGGEQR
jgi:general stress protein YciG